MLIIGLGVVMYGWAVIASLRKHENADAVMWLASGLLLGIFVVLDHLGMPRWVSVIVLVASVTIGLLAGWRSQVRNWRSQ